LLFAVLLTSKAAETTSFSIDVGCLEVLPVAAHPVRRLIPKAAIDRAANCFFMVFLSFALMT
jgi:hypothetical protein